MTRRLASILVGDHLGQVKKVLWPSGEISLLPDLAEPDRNNSVVSIEPLSDQYNRFLISNRNGDLYVYDAVKGKTKKCSHNGKDALIKALPFGLNDIVFIYEKLLIFNYSSKGNEIELKLKKGKITDARTCTDKLAVVGKDIPLRVYDLKTRNKIFEASPPERDWLGILPECHVAGLDFVGTNKISTCSKSDSVIRVYDIESSKTQPIISIDLNQTAFNEYAEAGRFLSVASSTGDQTSYNKSIVVGSNVGQLIAIELRLNVKHQPKKRLQPRTYKILGGFKGARGATIKDIKVIEADDGDESADYKVISLCLDRYLRVHNMSKTRGRHLDKHVYMKTKPICCSPIFYQGDS